MSCRARSTWRTFSLPSSWCGTSCSPPSPRDGQLPGGARKAVVLGKAVHLRQDFWPLTKGFHRLTCRSEQQSQPAESHQRHLRLVAHLSETSASRTYYF